MPIYNYIVSFGGVFVKLSDSFIDNHLLMEQYYISLWYGCNIFLL